MSVLHVQAEATNPDELILVSQGLLIRFLWSSYLQP